MSDDRTNHPQDVAALQADLNTKGLSRRKFLDRLKALGVGFGAAAAIAGEASAREASDKVATLKSTNPALDGIVTEGRQEARPAAGDDERVQVAQFFYRRFRGYRRFFRYRRFFYRRFF